MPDESQDALTSIFLFHQLPPKVRSIVFSECARVLKPGGRLVLVDSLQRGDQPDYDGLLELFPQNYHEPYYKSYTNENFRRPCHKLRFDAHPRCQGLRLQGDGLRQADNGLIFLAIHGQCLEPAARVRSRGLYGASASDHRHAYRQNSSISRLNDVGACRMPHPEL